MEMHECSSYETCNANLCPLDPSLNDRCWYIGEEVCKGRAGSGKRWIAKQRSYNKRKPKTYMGKALGYQLLYDSSRKKQLSEAQLEALRVRMADMREKAKIMAVSTVSVGAN
jgi:hypothetical protein